MKIFNIFFCIAFIIFAGLQYNDPDPYVWMPIYLYGAFFCALAARNKFHRKAYLLGVFVYLVYAAYLFFDKTGVLDWIKQHRAESMVQTMQATKPWIEESREFFGLMILIVVLAINWIYSAKIKT
jgi:hypothetical protein